MHPSADLQVDISFKRLQSEEKKLIEDKENEKLIEKGELSWEHIERKDLMFDEMSFINDYTYNIKSLKIDNLTEHIKGEFSMRRPLKWCNMGSNIPGGKDKPGMTAEEAVLALLE